MSFLGRLFGRPAAAPPPAPIMPSPAAPAPVATPPAAPANSVVVPEDLVAALTTGGRSLSDAVVAALRENLASRAREAAAPAPEAATEAPEAPPAPTADRVPFWLAREEREPAIEDALRGKLERRRAAEGERAKGQPTAEPED